MNDVGVWTGIDVLARGGFRALRGGRVGLVTNQTGLTRGGLPTIDVLMDAPGVSLKALFGPEHGIRGDFDQPLVADGMDAKTGLPVYSLYGARTQPSSEQLTGLDTLVFDIQDIGCRFYTYLSTLALVLEAASAHGLRVIVLDRPNPIAGMHVEGPSVDGDKLAFVACHPIPVRHGQTLGELARLLHAEKRLTCPLEVIPCEGWRRGDWYDALGLLWTNPSPNMRCLTAAALYPGLGLLEFTNVSVGRGTDTPFEVFGTPYLDPRAFAAELNAAGLPGVRFVPIYFTPTASVFAGKRCGGVHVIVTDREALNSVQVGITVALTLRGLYLGEWQPERLITLLAHQQTYESIRAGRDFAAIMHDWAADLTAFAQRTKPYQIYQDVR